MRSVGSSVALIATRMEKLATRREKPTFVWRIGGEYAHGLGFIVSVGYLLAMVDQMVEYCTEKIWLTLYLFASQQCRLSLGSLRFLCGCDFCHIHFES